jgi:valyl-tRNA synthetase
MGFLIEIIRAIRNLRAEMNCPPSKQVRVILFGAEQEIAFLRAQEAYVRALARVGLVEYLTSGERPKGASTAVVGATEIYLPLNEMVDLRDERERLLKEIPKVEQELARVQKKLDNQAFLTNAKEEAVRKEKGKLQEFEERLQTLRRSLQRIEEISQAGQRA